MRYITTRDLVRSGANVSNLSLLLCRSIIAAVSKPFLGKMSDITSRPTVYTIALVFYCLGFIVAATSTTWAAYIIGLCFTSLAKSGLDLMADIIVSDLTPLQWRQFFTSGLTSPYFITSYVGGFIVEGLGLTDPDYGHWRWALGMFVIMMPAFVAPIIVLLYSLQWKAKRLGLVSLAASGMTRRGQAAPQQERSYMKLAYTSAVEMDLVGLVLLAFAFALILMPFSLAKAASGGWSNPSMVAMLVVGFVLLISFGLWEQYGAPIPLAPQRVLRNRGFLVAVFVDTLSQFSSFTASIYFSSYIYVTQDLTDYQWTALINTTVVGLVLFGMINGLLQRRFHRFKAQMLFGGLCKIIGYGICLEAGGRATTSLGALATSRVLIAFAGLIVGGARIASQAAVAHRDLATVIFTLSLWSSLGSAVGSAVSATIWQQKMVPYMRQELPPSVPDATIKKIYGSIKLLRSYAEDDPVRLGAIRAYQRVLGIMFAVSIAISILSFLITFLVPNYYLGSQRNLITNKDLDGNDVSTPMVRDTSNEQAPTSTRQAMWRRVRAIYDADFLRA